MSSTCTVVKRGVNNYVKTDVKNDVKRRVNACKGVKKGE